MKLSEAIKPISYFKAHASEILKDVSENKKKMIITQNGEAKAILQDLESYEQDKDTMALLKILAISNKDLAKGKSRPMADVMKEVREEITEYKSNKLNEK